MNIPEIYELIESGESTTVEFKRKAKTPLKIAKELAAFANTKGGFLFVGIDDDATIYGVRSEKSELDVIDKACNFFIDPPIKPEIEIAELKYKDVIIVKIRESKNKPHRLISEEDDDNMDNRVYIRIGEKCVIASREMTRLMKQQTLDKPVKLSIGDKEKRLFAYLDKYEKATVKEFAKLVNISTRRAERLMIRLVRAGVMQINNDEYHDYFTLIQPR